MLTDAKNRGESCYVQGELDGINVRNVFLVAALAAMGVPFEERVSSIVVGDGIAGDGRVTWYFAAKSECGQYGTKELMTAWEDETWHLKYPEHPFAYVKCALGNLPALDKRLRADAPIAQIRKGKKLALISLDASAQLQGQIFRRLERRG